MGFTPLHLPRRLRLHNLHRPLQMPRKLIDRHRIQAMSPLRRRQLSAHIQHIGKRRRRHRSDTLDLFPRPLLSILYRHSRLGIRSDQHGPDHRLWSGIARLDALHSILSILLPIIDRPVHHRQRDQNHTRHHTNDQQLPRQRTIHRISFGNTCTLLPSRSPLEKGNN